MTGRAHGSGREVVERAPAAPRAIALLLGLAATFVLASGIALARSPVLQSAKVQNQKATYTWSLPPGVKGRLVETATAPSTNSFGYFDPQRNQYSFNIAPDTATSLTDDSSFPPGTYYVHVGGEDTSIPGCPRREFSNVFLFVVNQSGDGTGADIGGGTPQCTTPGGGSGSSDTDRPSALLKLARRQDVDKLFVRARMDEPGSITASARVSTPGSSKLVRFTSVTRAVVADKWTKFRLKLKKRSLRKVKRALARGKRLRAKVTVVARDRSGNTRTKTARIRLTD